MTLCLYSLPPQNPSTYVNSRQELLTIYPISIPGNHRGHQKQGESGKLPQSKEDLIRLAMGWELLAGGA